MYGYSRDLEARKLRQSPDPTEMEYHEAKDMIELYESLRHEHNRDAINKILKPYYKVVKMYELLGLADESET